MRAFTIIEAPQRSPEWFAARCGRLTGSVAGEMLAKIKTGESAGRRNLRVRLVLERLTGRPQEPGFVSAAMETGIEREADAFGAFEALTGNVAVRTGFLAHTEHLAGCSLDGHIGAFEALTGNVAVRTGFLAHTEHMAGCSLDGHIGDFEVLVSIKCRQPSAHLDFLRSGAISASAMAQIRHELWMTGAQAHEYFSWNPDFPPALQSRLVTVSRADAGIAEYEALALAFLAEVEAEVAGLSASMNVGRVLKEALA